MRDRISGPTIFSHRLILYYKKPRHVMQVKRSAFVHIAFKPSMI